MAPPKRKCCIPYCGNMLGSSNKKFFKVTSNNNNKDIENWVKNVIDKSYAATRSTKPGGLYSCEDHYDLPNDAENFIRHKYLNGTKLKLRDGVLPRQKIPFQVCRVCLKMIYTNEEYVEVTENSSQHIKDVFSTCLPEIDFTITTPTMSCMECYKAVNTYYGLKLKALTSEITVVNCVKAVTTAAEKVSAKVDKINLLHFYDTVKYIFEKENGEQLMEVSTSDDTNTDKPDSLLANIKDDVAKWDHIEIVEDDLQIVDDDEEKVKVIHINKKTDKVSNSTETRLSPGIYIYTSDESTSESEHEED